MYKKILTFAGILFLISLFAFTYISKKPISEKKSISIEKALSERIVSVTISGAGGHSGDVIDLELKSLIPVDTLIKIEAGRRLTSNDTLLQDILIVRELELFLAANEVKKLKLFGFCCQASNGGPKLGSEFKVGFMEDSSFIYLARFLSKSNLPIGVMQSAIWVLSDNHALNSIHNDNEKDKEKMKGLFGLLASIKGLEYMYPWYTLKYKTDTSRVFSNRPKQMFAEVEYYLSHQSNVDLFIKDSNDLLVKKLFINRPHHPGDYNYRFTLDVANMPKGKYYLRLYADNQLKMLKEFEL